MQSLCAFLRFFASGFFGPIRFQCQNGVQVPCSAGRTWSGAGASACSQCPTQPVSSLTLNGLAASDSFVEASRAPQTPVISTTRGAPTIVSVAISRNATVAQCFQASTITTLATYFEWSQLAPFASVDDGYLPPYYGIAKVPATLTPAPTNGFCASYFFRKCEAVPVTPLKPRAALSTSSTLSLDPFTLMRESVYLFQVQATDTLSLVTNNVQKIVNVTSRAWAWIYVGQSALVPVISGGSAVSIWYDAKSQGAVLDASASYDPDGRAALSFAWSCVTLTAGQCPALPAGGATGQKLWLPAAWFAPYDAAVGYKFTLVLSDQSNAAADFNGALNRQATASVVVTGYTSPLPTVHLSVSVPSQGLSFTRITSIDTIVVTATVLSVIDRSPVSLAQYSISWSCDVPGAMATIAAAGKSKNGFVDSLTLVIGAGLLSPGVAYTFVASVKLRAGSTSESSRAAATVSVSGVPYGGTCSVTPDVGVALVTKFSILCTGFTDIKENLPLSYRFLDYDEDTQKRGMLLQEFQMGPGISTFLSAGLPHSVLIMIRNQWGAQTSVIVRTNVTNPPISTAADVASITKTGLSDIAAARLSGDLNAAAQSISPITAMLNEVAASKTQVLYCRLLAQS